LEGSEFLEETGDVFQISEGFALQQQEVNEYENSTDIIDAKRFLTPQEKLQVVKGEPAYLHVYTGAETDRSIQYRNLDGTFPVTVTLPANTRVWRVPIGIDEVEALYGSANFDPSEGFLIQIIDSVTTATYQQIRVTALDKSFCDVPTDTIAYINRFGAWDYIHLRGQTFETVSQERTAWDKRIGRINPSGAYTYTQGESQVGVTEVVGGKSFALNTGYVRADSINEKLTDMMMSKSFFSRKLSQPVILETQQVPLQNDSGPDLINYELQFRIAGNLIQDIQ
jgi:hypothetical protein